MQATNIALSGLAAATARLSAAAENLANAQSAGYKPQAAVQTTGADGGVSVQVQNANSGGVDPAQEMVNTSIASYDFQANLKTLEAQNKLSKDTLDILT